MRDAQAVDVVDEAVDPSARFSPALLGVMLVFTVGSTLVWYRARKAGLHIGKKEAVVGLYWVGLVVYFGALWALRGVAPWRLRRETWLVPVSAMALLSVFWLYGRVSGYRIWVGAYPPKGGLEGLLPYFFFVGASVLLRLVLPLVVGRVACGQGPAGYGWRWKGAFDKWWIYLGLVLLVVPAVWWASSQPAFLRTYPWCRRALEAGTIAGPVFLVYAGAALLFYTSGEAFWRGYILLGAGRQLGWNAMGLMLMPYVLGHLGKPLAETLGAVAAGLVLGGLAWHHRSFWMGAVCHWLVAMSMDLAAMWRKGIEWIW